MSHVTVPGAASGYRLERDPHYRGDRTYGAGYPFCSPAHEEDVRRRMEEDKQRLREMIAKEIKEAMTEAELIERAIGHGHD